MVKKRLSITLGILLVVGAIAHLVVPEFYSPMIPDGIPEELANSVAFGAELLVGVSLILPQYRKKGGLQFMLLMIAFLPIHIWDLFRDDPAIGPHPAPAIRLAVQFVLIYAGWWLYRK